MNSRQQHLVRELIGKYSSHGTESLIAYVAETTGMLDACKALMHGSASSGSVALEWLQQECADLGVFHQSFLKEVERIVALFAPDYLRDDHYATLGLEATATPEEIKKAYRTLSRKYHPDTAAGDDANQAATFIAITKAYQALSNRQPPEPQEAPQKDWRRKKDAKVSHKQKKQLFLWLLGLVVVLAVVSTVASINMQRKAMLAGLKESRGAFIPPTKTAAPDTRQSPTDKIQAASATTPLQRAEQRLAAASAPSGPVVTTAVAPQDLPSAALTSSPPSEGSKPIAMPVAELRPITPPAPEIVRKEGVTAAPPQPQQSPSRQPEERPAPSSPVLASSSMPPPKPEEGVKSELPRPASSKVERKLAEKGQEIAATKASKLHAERHDAPAQHAHAVAPAPQLAASWASGADAVLVSVAWEKQGATIAHPR